jgi:hypothetical protein
MELFTSVENHSAKEVEVKLHSLAGAEAFITLVLRLNPEMKSAWDKIKNLSAHSTRGQDTEILNVLMKEWLKKNDPEEKIKKDRAKETSDSQSTTHHPSAEILSSLKSEALQSACRNRRVWD